MDSYNHSSLLKCICCGVAVLFFSAEVAPSVYQALCQHCHAHIGHLAKHNHQEEQQPSNAGGGIRNIVVSTTTATATTSGSFFLTS